MSLRHAAPLALIGALATGAASGENPAEVLELPSVTVIGTTPFSYQWRFYGADIPVIAVTGRLIARDNARDMQERWPGLIYSTPTPPTATPKP